MLRKLLITTIQAEKFEEHMGKNPVLALKGAKVSEFGGKLFRACSFGISLE